VETGGLLVFLAGCAGSLSANMLLPIHKGLIWLLVATIAEVLPAASGEFHVPVASTYHDVAGVYLFESEWWI